MNQMSNVAGRAFALLTRRHQAPLKVRGTRTVASSGANGSLEERLWNLTTTNDTAHDDDDMVSRYLVASKIFDYNSLCNLFIKMAKNGRRPTPLLKAASTQLCKLASSTQVVDKPKPELIITTLSSLVSLSYPNKALISKLIEDLIKTIKFEDLEPSHLCSLLRTMSVLRWRPDDLLKLLFNFIKYHNNECKAIDHNVIVAFLHVAATVNYRPEECLKDFYTKFMKGSREQMLDRNKRKWLNYVWSLVALDIADEEHIRSVLNYEFYKNISTIPDSTKVNHSDIMKLLNLRAIALYELKLENLECEHLLPLLNFQIQRSNEMEKFTTKVNESLNGSIINSPKEIRYVLQTPFGFVVDAMLLLNQNLEPIELNEPNVFENIEKMDYASRVSSTNGTCKRCALIYVSYEDTIVNYQNEAVGHKQMISRILENFGIETRYVPETVINREKTSADLTNRLKAIIKASDSEGKD